MAQETQFSKAGGDWLTKGLSNQKQVREVDAVPAMTGGGNAKTVEVATPSPSPASATVEAVPNVEAAGAVVSPQASEPKIDAPRGKSIVKVDDKETLIELPGERPKTAEQLQWELKRSRDVDRREQELRQRELRFQQSVEQRTVEKAPPVVTPAPKPHAAAPPAGFVEGDPEYEEWKIQRLADMVTGPVLARMDKLEQEQASQRIANEQGEVNLASNRTAYAEALTRQLPFDFEGLPQEVQIEVDERIKQSALAEGIDLESGLHMRQRSVGVDTMRLFIANAFPPGSLPPGYEIEPSAELLALRQIADKPLVDPPKPDPLPLTGIGAIAAVMPKSVEEPKGPIDWSKKMRSWERAPA